MLRWLGAGTPVVAQLSQASNRSRNRINQHLWHEGVDQPQPGYLEFLAALAEHGNLLDPPDVETRANPALRAWRSRSFLDQTAYLRDIWLGSVAWVEALAQEDVIVTGAHWPQFRRRLLVLLPELDPQRWYRLDELARWLAARSSDALGDAVQIATARPVDATLDRSIERLSSLEHVVERTLRSGFSWFGIIDIAHIPSVGEVARVTNTGLATVGAREPDPPPTAIEPAIEIHPDLTVTLRDPTPVRIWALTAFADQMRLHPSAEYRISNRSLKRALAAGFRVDDVMTFLERQGGLALEQAARAQLRSWAETLGRVWLAPALIVQPEQDEDIRALRATLEALELRVTPHGPAFVVEGSDGLSAETLASRVERGLLDAGKTPQFRASPEALVADERSAPGS
ncbi:MAG: helicase-associated domain-containing protein [Thermomicrobiales bacterium]|nr:helicase-associated domain-containing protein [Thermomicrobiales bacterium]